MKRVVLFITMFFVAVLVLPVAQAGGNTVMPNVTPVMLTEDFWINKLQEPSKVILDQSQIAKFNQEVIARLPDKVYDLRQYPGELVRDDLMGLITIPMLPETSQYVNGRPATAAYYSALKTECDLHSIGSVMPMRYGFTVTRASIRTFPTADCVTSQSDDREFDAMQETAVDPVEPVVILHQSLNKAWYYVQTYNYRGWLPVGAVAVAASRQEWLEYLDSAEFLTVTAKKLKIGDSEFAMGAKLPLVVSRVSALNVDRLMAGGKYIVRLPIRAPNGELVFELDAVAADDRVVHAYLPYTRENIISQVFKLQGERYGWGGMYGGWDCSSLVLDVYRSFGLKLPRNADEQELAAGRIVNFSASNRVAQLASLEPGAAVYMPGHVMLYLGEQDGHQYSIHALGGYSTANGRIPIMRVVVSDLSLKRRSGETFIDALTIGKQFQ